MTVWRGGVGPLLEFAKRGIAVLVAVRALVACSAAEDPMRDAPSSTALDYTEADVVFARATIPHGEQGADMSGMNHGSDGGMATDAELNEFDQADGKPGQKTYLQLMTAHHQGAIEMAEAEVSNGKNPDAIALAKNIVTTQQQEVRVMEDLLATL